MISLLKEPEEWPGYDKKVARGIGFVLLGVPIKDRTAPTPQHFRVFRGLVEDALSRGKVLVHCWGGCGRTGTMGAAYWIDRGMSAKDAIDKMRLANPEAMETEGQGRSLDDLAHSLETGEQ